MPTPTPNTGPQGALLRGVEAVLREHLAAPPADGRPAAEVGLTGPDGRPPPGAWTWFYAVCGEAVKGRSRYAGRVESVYGCRVVVTARLQGVPEDRVGDALLALSGGLHDRVDALAATGLIHGSYAVITAANAALDLGDDGAQGFHEPLYFDAAERAAEKSPEWFGAKGQKALGYAAVVSFSGANYQKGLV